ELDEARSLLRLSLRTVPECRAVRGRRRSIWWQRLATTRAFEGVAAYRAPRRRTRWPALPRLAPLESRRSVFAIHGLLVQLPRGQWRIFARLRPRETLRQIAGGGI